MLLGIFLIYTIELMVERLIELKIDRIIKEYSFLKSDEEYKKEVIDENTVEFLKIINERLNGMDPNSLKEQSKGPVEFKKPKPKIDINTISENDKIKIKKVYRDIVKLTHPDKVEDQELNLLYIEAKEAYEILDFIELCFIAKGLKIHIKLKLEETKLLTALIESKKNDLKLMEGSFIWIWANADDDTKKEEIVELFIKNNYLK